jgi:uncharacterized membrane protein
MRFLGSWIKWGFVIFVIAMILANIFFDLTWFHSRSEIPTSSLCLGLVGGFLSAIHDASNGYN